MTKQQAIITKQNNKQMQEQNYNNNTKHKKEQLANSNTRKTTNINQTPTTL